MRFAPEYVTYVLNENFEDAKALFLSPLMAIHYAHLVMLADAGHRVRDRRAHAARCARPHLAGRRSARSTTTAPARICSSTSIGSIVAACGEDVAGRLHTARSRNDIDMTMYRMRQREFILGSAGGDLRRCAGRCSTWPIATARRSSPCTRTRSGRSRRTVAHYLLGVVEQLERDGVAAEGAPTSAPTATRSARARSPAPGFRSIAS